MKTEHIKSSSEKQFVQVIVAAQLLLLCGCMAAMQSATYSGHPKFQDVERSWPPLSPSQSRIVIFYPREAGEQILLGYRQFYCRVDDGVHDMHDGIFIWMDRPPGTHTIKEKRGAIFGWHAPVEFTTTAGQTCFVKVKRGNPSMVVEREAALTGLAHTRHFFEDARSADR